MQLQNFPRYWIPLNFIYSPKFVLVHETHEVKRSLQQENVKTKQKNTTLNISGLQILSGHLFT